MDAQRRNRRNRDRAIRLLEAAGYSCAYTARSLSMFDIVAISRKEIRLVRLRSSRCAETAEKSAIQEFTEIPSNASKELWIFYDYARTPIIKPIASDTLQTDPEQKSPPDCPTK